MVEVLSPQPRVGDFDRRLEWFAAYGVQECWAYDQAAQHLEIITFAAGCVTRGTVVELDDAIVSGCLPDFSLTLPEVLER